jgi:fructose-bisphosphate aldolase, class I
MVDLGCIMREGKALILAYDQGLEHGPTDFNEKNVDPEYIVKIARDSGVYSGLVFQAGLAEKYYGEGLPTLLLKLNGRTSFHKNDEPVSLQLTSVGEAAELGAGAVGYTVYVGSEFEETMLVELRRIIMQAHEKNMPVVAWMYPRGKRVEGRESSVDVLAYAARISLELGADVCKLPYTGDSESFAWVVKCAGRTKVVVQGGGKKDEEALLNDVRGIMKAGAVGMAIGRNVWQADDPVDLSKKIAEIVYAA